MSDYQLRTAVTKLGAKPQNFSLYKGEKDAEVLITPLKPTPKQIQEVEAECGKVRRVTNGLCLWEGTKLVFRIKGDSNPSHETLVNKVFKERKCSQFLPIEFRPLGPNEPDEVSSEQLDESLRGIVPEPPPTVAPIGTTAPNGGSSPPNPGAALAAALERIAPAIKQCVANHPERKDEILRPVAEFQAHLKNGRTEEAKRTLTVLAMLLKSLGTGGEGEFARNWTMAKEAWRAAIETVDEQLNKVRSAMLATGDPELAIIADQGLPALTDDHKTPVMRALFEIDGLTGDARKQSAARSLTAIGAFRTHIETDPRVKVMDEQAQSALGAPLTIRASIGKGLDALEAALKPLTAR